jgi:hypothetical protein
MNAPCDSRWMMPVIDPMMQQFPVIPLQAECGQVPIIVAAPAPSPVAVGRGHAAAPPSTIGQAQCILIFGLLRLRSSTFIGIRINVAMQVMNASAIRRTIIQTSENRKVGGSTAPGHHLNQRKRAL